MQRLFFAAIATAACVQSMAADVSVSIAIGEPGFYGRIDVGGIPHPELIFPQPMIISPIVGIAPAPIYLHVPRGHAKDWRKHCRKYNACGERVFFVHDHWYNDIYVPHYRKRHGKPSHESKPGKGRGNGKNKD